MAPFWGGDSVTCTPVTVVHGVGKREANKRASLAADEHPPFVEEAVAVVPNLLASGNAVMSLFGFHSSSFMRNPCE